MNPQGLTIMTAIAIDKDRCTRCSICAKVCPVGIIGPADEARLPQVSQSNASRCAGCGHCEISCPAGALMLDLGAGDGYGPRAEFELGSGHEDVSLS
ncbi:MAG TPA: 4Fe-4S binding protein, partial [Methanotrichaceae archaeon]|nr:4Fe-4S binding protein [Methanotrichaceae archaeon]